MLAEAGWNITPHKIKMCALNQVSSLAYTDQSVQVLTAQSPRVQMSVCQSSFFRERAGVSTLGS